MAGSKRGKKTYTAGDSFIDYPTMGFAFTGKETVGSASDYQRTSRRSTEPLPGHFIRTPVDVPLYAVSVEYDDHPWMNYRTIVSSENNLVPVPVPPLGEKGGVTVMPVGVNSENPLYFRSEEFNRNFAAAAARGYYIEHDFKVSGPIPTRTEARAGGNSGTPSGASTRPKPEYARIRGFLVPRAAHHTGRGSPCPDSFPEKEEKVDFLNFSFFRQ